MRAQLRALLESGINPLTYFDRDYKKYFYLAGELFHWFGLFVVIHWPRRRGGP